MKKILLAASAAAVAFAAQNASAAEFVVNVSSTPVTIPSDNNFKNELDFLGLPNEGIGATVSVGNPNAWTQIKLEFLGSESWDQDQFSFNNTLLVNENSLLESHFGLGMQAGDTAPIDLGTFLWNSTSFPALFTSLASNASPAAPGQSGFTVFLPNGVGTGTYSTDTLYFGYDDIPGGDDNHDDIIIRASIVSVPEPATWALMVAGIAAVGVSMRRRSRNVRVAFS